MGQKSQLIRRLGQDLEVASEAGRAVFRHADGSTLGLPLMAAVDVFLDTGLTDPTAPLPFSLEAVAFLAACDVVPTMSDVDASLIRRAREQVALTLPEAKA